MLLSIAYASLDDRCCAELICSYEITNDLKLQQGCVLFTLVRYVSFSLWSTFFISNATFCLFRWQVAVRLCLVYHRFFLHKLMRTIGILGIFFCLAFRSIKLGSTDSRRTACVCVRRTACWTNVKLYAIIHLQCVYKISAVEPVTFYNVNTARFIYCSVQLHEIVCVCLTGLWMVIISKLDKTLNELDYFIIPTRNAQITLMHLRLNRPRR